MNFEQIEAALGRKFVTAVGVAVEAAYQRSELSDEGRLALSQLLVAHLASVIAVPGGTGDASNRASYCAELLIGIVEELNDIDAQTDNIDRTFLRRIDL